MNFPECAEVNGRKYKINTDFRVAIKCNEIAENPKIHDYERALGIICTLFGKEAVRNHEDQTRLLEIAKIYLSCGEETKKSNSTQVPDMDLIEDEKYIKSSFKYDYNYDPYKLNYLHWYEFYNDLSNLSNSEFGDCCILNRVRNLRNINLNEIKDNKEREKIRKAKQQVALKKYQHKKVATPEQLESARKFYEQLGLLKKE